MNKRIEAALQGLGRAVRITLALLLVCGLGYPLLMTGVAQLAFPRQANGSLLAVNGQPVGSQLVGQDFTADYFMKCRPSAVDYNTYTPAQRESGEYPGLASGSQNLGPTNPALVERVEADLAVFLEKNPQCTAADIPTDLLTASGSGLDPHISPAAAQVQLPGLAEASGIPQEKLEELVAAHTQGRLLGIFGESRVNVLEVNLEIAREMGLLAL